ncbi:MAG: hypothetical protein ACI8P9_005304 [Parasphingorhabdus sp.]|jgi:hypothetical protein
MQDQTHNDQLSSYLKLGWTQFEFDTNIDVWVRHALPCAKAAIISPDFAQWFRNNNTWFVGVNALPNDPLGRVGKSSHLQGKVTDFIKRLMPDETFQWDQGQISVCYPSYPQPWEGETEAAHQYRLKRDAAHVDGLAREGPQLKRHLREHHAFILGIPLVSAPADASPVVIWEGSHQITRDCFKEYLQHIHPDNWGDVDVTKRYHELRKQIFHSCNRIELAVQPGECYLIHRLAMHGIAPWRNKQLGYNDGRIICYFRPELDDPGKWLSLR